MNFQCPDCAAECISITNGKLRCGQCGKQQELKNCGVRVFSYQDQELLKWIKKETEHGTATA